MTDPPPRAPSTKAEAAFDWCFRSRRTGAVTIAQLPNLPLWIFIATVALRFVLPDGSTAADVASWVGTGALGWWALDELIRGENPWRRLLGVAGCLLVLSRLVGLVL